jgi:hypothetical protein
MLSDEDKTPPLVMLAADVERPPLVTIAPGAERPRPPLLAPHKTPPPGRPPGALAISELVEKVTKDVSAQARTEIALAVTKLERENATLRAEVTAQMRVAMGLAIIALGMNAIGAIAVVAFTHHSVGAMVALVLAGLGMFAIGGLAGRHRDRARRALRGDGDIERAEAAATTSLAAGAHAAWSGSESRA